jgi:hypothetical protein
MKEEMKKDIINRKRKDGKKSKVTEHELRE